MKHVFTRNLAKTYPVVREARGSYLTLADGRRVFDGASGAVVTNLGHAHPDLVAEVRAQVDRAEFVHNSLFVTDELARAAEAVARHLPPELGHVYFVNSGSEATETAIKLAHTYHRLRGEPGRWRVVARWDSYHGNTLGALAASGHRGRRQPYAPLLLDFPHFRAVNTYRLEPGETAADAARRSLDDLRAVLEAVGPETVSAVLVEPVVGATLAAMAPPPGYLTGLRAICDRAGALLVFDEVMCGSGRTGRMFAFQHEAVVPDLVTLGKGLANGVVPVAGVAAHRRIVEAVRAGGGRFVHGHTYAATPLGMAVVARVVAVMERYGMLARAEALGGRVRAGLEALAREFPWIGDVRGKGALLGMEFVADPATRQPFPPAWNVTERLNDLLIEEGAVLYPCRGVADGTAGDALLVAPPYTATDDELGGFFDSFRRAARRLEAEVLGRGG